MMALICAADQTLRKGLHLVGHDDCMRGNVEREANVDRLKSALGPRPIVCAEISNDLQTTAVVAARITGREVDVECSLTGTHSLDVCPLVHRLRESPTATVGRREPTSGCQHQHSSTAATMATHPPAAAAAAAAAGGAEDAGGEEEAWANSETKRVLRTTLRSGEIPLSSEQTPLDIVCWQDPSFAALPCEESRDRLDTCRKESKKKKALAADDLAALQSDRLLCPRSTTDSNGELRWEGSDAERLLRLDIDGGGHDQMKPEGLKKTRKEHNVEGLGLETSRGHTHQGVKTREWHAHLGEEGGKKKKKEERESWLPPPHTCAASSTLSTTKAMTIVVEEAAMVISNRRSSVGVNTPTFFHTPTDFL